MAGEDNDKDEINHFNSFHERIEWETNQTGAVGHYHLSGLADVLSKYFDSIGNHEMNKLAIKSLIETTFNASNTLSDFTYHLVSELFKDKGLIILNPDNVQFKAAFSPFIKKDIFEQINYTAVVSTIEKLENKGFIKKGKAQVHPREINFFYLDTQYRERIVFDGSQYQTIDKKFTWKNEELINEIDSNPQKFSPNVVTRPLYQQFIIPNLAYIGGPGEIAYWLEYKEAFRLNNIQMPVLVPRKFIYVIEKNYADKMEKLEIDLLQIFQLTVDELKTNWIANKNITQIDLSEYQLKFNELFDLIQNQVIPIDKTLSSYIEAERTKTIGFIQNLESKTLRALKRSEESSLQQIEKLKNRLFPKLIPQERHFNIFNYLLKYDFLFIEDIYESINYDEGGILILTEK
jgi:bacillithiol biosynthesis cysteine-adding enzyme BshC